MSHTSASLLDRARNPRDREAWFLFADIYEPLIRGWLRRYALQESDADDLVQDVLRKIAAKLPEFQHNQRPGAFRCWVRVITTNELRHWWRDGRFRPSVPGTTSFAGVLEQLEDPGSALSGVWDQEHDRHIVRRMLQATETDFQPTTWEAFRRHVIEGRQANEVATELGLTVNAVFIAKSRVLQRLRERLKGFLD